MNPADVRLIAAALIGIALAVALIVKGRLHPFIGLLCGAFTVGLIAGLPLGDTAKAVQKGVGDIVGGTGLVVALGLSLGAMLQLSNAASSLAQAGLRLTGPKAAPWASLFIAILIGLPLFFETGLVLLVPIVAAAAASLPEGPEKDEARLKLMLPALAGLSVVHALVPPHPGPLLAVTTIGADLGRTMIYGVLIAIPTAILAGPALALVTARGVRLTPPAIEQNPPDLDLKAPSHGVSLFIVLLPVLLIAAGEFGKLVPGLKDSVALEAASNPVLALLLTNLLALPLLFGARLRDAVIQETIWSEALQSAGAILLAIGAGGALKQVLVSAGLADMLVRLASVQALSPLLLGWLIAVAIRLATGSATVATITASGVMPGIVAATGASPELMVLAIGAGSVFFSHVNDPGFWLVRGYLGTSTADTFRTWSALETAISVVGLAFVLAASYLV